MCKSIAEGGQRCAAHTRGPALDAIEKLNAHGAAALTQKDEDAIVAYASTPSGKEHLQQIHAEIGKEYRDGMDPEELDAVAHKEIAIQNAIERGDRLAAANKDIGEIFKRREAQAQLSARDLDEAAAKQAFEGLGDENIGGISAQDVRVEYYSLISEYHRANGLPVTHYSDEGRNYARENIGERARALSGLYAQYQMGITPRKFADPRAAERILTINRPDGSEGIIFQGEGTDGLPIYAVQDRYTAADGQKDVTTPVRFDTLDQAKAYATGESDKGPYFDLGSTGTATPSYTTLTDPTAQTYIAAVRQAHAEGYGNDRHVAMETFFTGLRKTGKYDNGTIDEMEESVADAISGYRSLNPYELKDGRGDSYEAEIKYSLMDLTDNRSVALTITYDILSHTSY